MLDGSVTTEIEIAYYGDKNVHDYIRRKSYELFDYLVFTGASMGQKRGGTVSDH